MSDHPRKLTSNLSGVGCPSSRSCVYLKFLGLYCDVVGFTGRHVEEKHAQEFLAWSATCLTQLFVIFFQRITWGCNLDFTSIYILYSTSDVTTRIIRSPYTLRYSVRWRAGKSPRLSSVVFPLKHPFSLWISQLAMFDDRK